MERGWSPLLRVVRKDIYFGHMKGAQSIQKQEYTSFLPVEWKLHTVIQADAMEQVVIFPDERGEETTILLSQLINPLPSALYFDICAFCTLGHYFPLLMFSVSPSDEWSLVRSHNTEKLSLIHCDWERLSMTWKDLKCRKLFIQFMKTVITVTESFGRVTNYTLYLNVKK